MAGFLLGGITAVDAHGIVGARFFPATITVDDPFAADELALPTISVFRGLEDGAPVTETEYELEYSKTIFPGFALSFEGGYVHAAPEGEPSASGFDNVTLTPILEILRSNEHEFIASVAFSWEIGGSGSRSIGGRASIFTPKVQFGKGFGDLPDCVALLRPFAVTGTVGYAFSDNDEVEALAWGGAVEYNLAYLQANVRDMGLGAMLSRLTPLVEFRFDSPLGQQGGGTTGTINPGFIWSGQKIQVGIEAIIPVNHATGRNVGVVAQLHFYIDDIFPHSLGTPLFK